MLINRKKPDDKNVFSSEAILKIFNDECDYYYVNLLNKLTQLYPYNMFCLLDCKNIYVL